VPIFEEDSEERGKRGLLGGGGKRLPSLLNLAPTNVAPNAFFEDKDYDLKAKVNTFDQGPLLRTVGR
jgi:hypothetical protein